MRFRSWWTRKGSVRISSHPKSGDLPALIHRNATAVLELVIFVAYLFQVELDILREGQGIVSENGEHARGSNERTGSDFPKPSESFKLVILSRNTVRTPILVSMQLFACFVAALWEKERRRLQEADQDSILWIPPVGGCEAVVHCWRPFVDRSKDGFGS